MKRTTRAKAKWRRRQSKAECASQVEDIRQALLDEEAARIEHEMFDYWDNDPGYDPRDDWFYDRELEQDEAIWCSEIHDWLDSDLEDDWYYDSYDIIENDTYLVKERATELLNYHWLLSREERAEVQYMALKLKKLCEVTYARSTERRRDRSAS